MADRYTVLYYFTWLHIRVRPRYNAPPPSSLSSKVTTKLHTIVHEVCQYFGAEIKVLFWSSEELSSILHFKFMGLVKVVVFANSVVIICDCCATNLLERWLPQLTKKRKKHSKQ